MHNMLRYRSFLVAPAGQGYPYPWAARHCRGALGRLVHLQDRQGGKPQEVARRLNCCSPLHRR